MEIINNTVRRSGVCYPGANRKFGIVIDGANYMLKIAGTDNDRLGICSEYIGTFLCHNQLKLQTSELRLVIYEGKLSLLSKDWNLHESEQFFPLSSYYEELLDEIDGGVSYCYDLFKRIIKNKCADTYDYVMKSFWLQYIVDFLICNSHSAGNIGFIHGDKIRLAPIYDCETRLHDVNDYSFKDYNFPSQHMDFGLGNNSSYFILNHLNDSYKDYAIEYARKHINLAELEIDSRVKEEVYIAKVVSYRYKMLFER